MSAAKQIVFGVTGSIAAYKAAELVRLMVRRGWEVQVILTEAAQKFVGELTFRSLSRHPVLTGMFDNSDAWQPEHIAIAERADVLVVAPCTARTIARLAHGLADDLLSCTYLSVRVPVVVAPAMNERMWTHPATQANLAVLRARGVHVVEPGDGDLACGKAGLGRLAEPLVIMEAVEQALMVPAIEERSPSS
ncbi:MAG: flavoprotein [bacterium]